MHVRNDLNRTETAQIEKTKTGIAKSLKKILFGVQGARSIYTLFNTVGIVIVVHHLHFLSQPNFVARVALKSNAIGAR